MSAVKLDTLTKRFGESLAVDRLSMEIAAGEIFALAGPDGAGKTASSRSARSAKGGSWESREGFLPNSTSRPTR